ncbi:MAG: hypothetical protein E6R00_04130 [Gammaproteobacteria bacterium]|nr:MAG: hypothetical protein E6R00_04130 [Gammaproteobacteria bacterium]
MQTRKQVGPPLNLLDLSVESSDRYAYQNRFVPYALKGANHKPLLSLVQRYYLSKGSSTFPDSKTKGTAPKTLAPGSGTPSRPGDDLEAGAAATDLGIVFLERTRLRPGICALGEQVFSMSLAPGEEVVLEQKTFSEKTVTYEEQSELEEETNSEMGSTLTTDLTNALTLALSETKNRNVTMGASAGLAVGGGNFSISAGVSDSVSNAMSDTSNETVRNTHQQTQKLSAKRRAQHKVSFKVSTTDRFETSQKRVIKNPNQYTPIDLVYFKILQKLEIAHERTGLRLCWAPFVRDPGVVLDEAENAARRGFEKQTLLNLPAQPVRPIPPTGAGVVPIEKSSLVQELDLWGVWGDMRADYWFPISAPAGFRWDGDSGFISATLNVSKTGWDKRAEPNVYVVRAEPGINNSVRVLIHAGADWGGAGAHLYMEFKARFESDSAGNNAAYTKALAEWTVANAAWDKEVARLKMEYKAAIDQKVAEWKANYLKTFDPAHACFQLLISLLFPPQSRDEGFEVEAWNKIFDFKQAAFQFYPSWWSDRGSRNPSKPADAFENASWLRIFLMIRPGFESQALNLILDRRVFTTSTNPTIAGAIDKTLQEIDSVRRRYFGGPNEIKIISGNPCPKIQTPTLCLGRWDEWMPTDGTHLEVVQAKTTAMDDVSEQAVADAHSLLGARIDQTSSEGELTSEIKDQVSAGAKPPQVDVVIGLGSSKPD